MANLAVQIDTFFSHLIRMELGQCQSIVSDLEDSAAPESEPAWWATYLRGVLCNERDRDWDTSERLFRSLLQHDLPNDLSLRVRNALANTYQYLGQWQEAVDIYHQILETTQLESSQPESSQPETKELETAEQETANSESSVQALANLEKAKIWKNIAIASEIGFSNGVFGEKELRLARDYCDTALATIDAVNDHPPDIQWLESTLWNTRGLILSHLQEWAEALQCFEKFRSYSESGNDQYDIAVAQQNMGEVYQKMGNPTAAKAMYSEAQTTYQRFNDSYRVSELLVNQAILHYDQAGNEWADLEEAISAIEQAAQLSESIRVRLTAPLAQMGYRATTEKLYRTLISVNLARGDSRKAFSAAERARSRVLADLLLGQRPSVSDDVPPELTQERSQIVEKITNFDMVGGEQSLLVKLESRLGEIDRQIELFDPNYALFDSVQSLTATEVQHTLPKDAVLLSYTIDIADHLWIMLITPTEIVHEKVEGITATWLSSFLSDHVDGVRQGVLVPDQSGSLSAPTLFPLLYRALIKPVAHCLEAAEKIYIVPAGPLHYLPVGALITYAESAELDKPSESTPRFIYGPSATVLFQFCHRRQRSSLENKLIVAPTDAQLAHTVDFAQQKMSHPSVQVLLGAAATRSEFIEQAGNYRVLCFLGHALFDQQHPMSSRLQLVDGDLRASEILREVQLDADLVMLSACETGRNQILAGDELLGLTRALFYAGTPSILTTLWPVHEIPTLLLVDKILQQIDAADAGRTNWDPAAFLAEAQGWLRGLTYAAAQEHLRLFGRNQSLKNSLDAVWEMTHPTQPPAPDEYPFAHPFFWAPYILVGASEVLPEDYLKRRSR